MTYAIGKDALKQSVQVTDSDEQEGAKIVLLCFEIKKNPWNVWIAYVDRIRLLT